MATERKNPFTGQTHLTPSDLTSKRILVFDLETTELAPKGRSPKGLNISVGAVRDLSTGQTTVYGHNEVPNLIEHLYKGDVVTGYNINKFDIEVLKGYTLKDLNKDLNVVDLADVIGPIWKLHGGSSDIPKLSNVLGASNLTGKLGTGANAPLLWSQGKIDELRKYVSGDVLAEGDLVEHIIRQGKVSFFMNGLGQITEDVKIPVPGLGRTVSFFAGKPPPPNQGGAVFNAPNSPIGGGGRRNRTFEWLRHGIEDFDKIGISNKSMTAHIWNFAKAFEESFGNVPRTFELSTISSVFATRGKGTKITISPEALKASRYYYSELLGRTLVDEDFHKGLTFQGRKVFLGDEEIRGHFSAVQRHWRSSAENHAPFFSRIARAYETARGYRATPLINLKDPQPYQSGANFIIVGAKTKLGLLGRHLEAGAITLSQRYFRLLDDPIEGVGALLGREGEFSLGLNKRAPAIMKAYNYAIRNRLGLGRAMDKELGGLGSQWLRHSGQLAKYLIGGAFAYHLVDNLMEDTIGLGIGDIGAKLYQGANLAVSTLSYVTGLTAIRRAQEKVSPDSTSKLAVLAYPASGAITGAVIAGALNAKDRFKFGPAALERISEKTPFKGLMSLVFKSEYTRIGRFARTGGAIGAIASALISLPFGIGSIGHKYTPGELLDIYRGKEEVPVRKARFWEFGRTPWQGGQIQYYRPHWSVVAQTRYKEKALFDKDESFLFRAIKQTEILKDIVAPYYLEDSHGTDRPYPIAVGHSTGLGPLSAIYNLTLAKLFKPQRFQYVDKWQSGDDPSLWGTDRDAAGMAAAVDYTKRVTLRPGNLLSESENLAQRIGDAFGLPGFIAESLNENILGRRTWLGQQAVLQPSADMNSAQRNFWDLSLGGGATTCFKPNTMIKTELGCKFIQDIEPGDMILNQDGYKKVINKVKKIGSEFITVKTSILPRIFTCTTNHWIPIVRRHTYKNGHPKPFIPKNIDFLEIQAKDLKLDDLLLYPIDYTEEIAIIDLKNGGKCFTENWVYYQASHDFAKAYELLEINPDLTRKDFRQLGIPDLIGKEALRQFRQNQCPKRCKRFYVIDKDLAWFLGWYIAEGCANSRNGQIQLTMNKNELVFAERLVAIIFDKFDSRAKISIEHNTLHLVFNHSALTSYLQAFGTKAPKKHIPLILKRMPRSILESLLAGLIEGDGSGSFSEGQFSFGSSSAELVKDVADSLLKLGIHCCTNLDFLEISKGLYPQGTPRKNCKRSYLISRDGRFDWKFFNGCYLIPVSDLEISCELAQDVYDLTIEDLHYYTAEGVLVHNTEFIRRLIPPKRSQALSINTIPNTSMPSWMPDTYMKLHQGDPFTKLLQGELRLPGKGFEARYPELSGVTPEDYPLAYRAKILSDVAPFSREFETLKQQGLAYSDSMSSREQFIFNQALKQADAKRNERLFADDPKNIFQWLNLKIKTIGRMNPIEHLIPLAPVHKFAGPISAIEDYKLNMIYSKEFTSWAHPFDSFVFPALKVAAHDLGWDGVPRDVREKRTIQEYFDRLEYLKYKTMARQAPFTGDPMESARYALASQKTLTGLNPFGTESNIYQALEGREEYYYIPFKNETNPRKQQKILELIPDQYKKIYRAAWAEKAAMSGDKEAIQQLTLLKQAKGEEINDKLIQQYKAETGNESLRYYAEWKRLQDTQEFFLENGLAIPDKNWAGFDPRVRMTDVKMRYVMEHGKDIHDFDLWESDQIGIDSRPWSAEAAEQLEDPDTRNPNILSMNLQSMFHTLGFRNVNVSVEEIIGFNRLSEVDMEFEHDRSRFTNPMAKFGY